MGPLPVDPFFTTCQMGDQHWGVRYEERRERECCLENRRLKEKGRGERLKGALARAKGGWLWGFGFSAASAGFGQTWWILGFWEADCALHGTNAWGIWALKGTRLEGVFLWGPVHTCEGHLICIGASQLPSANLSQPVFLVI